MKKNLLIIILVVFAIAGIAGYAFLSPMEDTVLDFSFTEEVVIKDGVIENEETIVPFTLDNDDTYVIRAEWTAGKPGMITGLAVKNKASENVYLVTGESVQSESLELELPAGDYEAQYVFFANYEDLERYLKEADAENISEEYTFASNETYEIEYNFKIVHTGSLEYRMGFLLGLLVVLFFGTLLVIITIRFPRKDGKLGEEYDERQLQARGNGFKYGFYTQIIYNGVLWMIHMAEVELPFGNDILLILGVLLAVFVWAIYCIHKEAYVSLNVNSTKLMIVFIILGILNLVIGIRRIYEGNIIDNDVVTFSCVNLICAIMLLSIAIVMKVHAKKIEIEEDEMED